MKSSMPRMRTALLGTALASLMMLTAGATVANAAGPQIVSPKRSSVFPVGSTPTFKVEDTSSAAKRYSLYIAISNKKSFKRSGSGKGDLIYPSGAKGGTFSSMKRSGSTFTYTPRANTFPGWFTITPAKYYWQAFHIDCGQRGGRCHVHTKLGSFFIR